MTKSIPSLTFRSRKNIYLFFVWFRWSTIASRLPGRTDHEIKNYWHTELKKRAVQQEPAASHSPPAVSMHEVEHAIASLQVDACVVQEEPPRLSPGTPAAHPPIDDFFDFPMTADFPAVPSPAPYGVFSPEEMDFWCNIPQEEEEDGSSLWNSNHFPHYIN